MQFIFKGYLNVLSTLKLRILGQTTGEEKLREKTQQHQFRLRIL